MTAIFALKGRAASASSNTIFADFHCVRAPPFEPDSRALHHPGAGLRRTGEAEHVDPLVTGKRLAALGPIARGENVEHPGRDIGPFDDETRELGRGERGLRRSLQRRGVSGGDGRSRLPDGA